MPKVSVIVPIYNVERFIERCARSLFMQTLDDVEYIFIDDCTPDNSVEKLEEVIKQFPDRTSQCRIEKLSENKGLAYVRHYGVLKATGDFVIHCDSDDWVDENMLEELYLEAKKSLADIVICDFYHTDMENDRYVKSCFSTDKDTFFYDCLCGKSYWSLWNKLVKRSLYDKVEVYPSLNMGEDMVVCLQLLYNSSRISYVEKAYYYYYINKMSIVRGNSKEQIANRYYQAINNARLVEQVLNKYISGVKFTLAFDSLKFRQQNLLIPLIGVRYYFKLWVSTYPELLYRCWFNPYITLRDKAKYYLSVFHLYKRL